MSIAGRRHKLLLCTQDDIVTENNDWIVNRKAVMSVWAAIKTKAGSTFNPHGASMSKPVQTHLIKIRYKRDVNVSNFAWLYEERRKSSPRWFKILKVSQTETSGTEYFEFSCRLVERGDEVPKPDQDLPESTNAAKAMPDGVSL